MLFTATLLAVRNQRILAAWNTRQQENQHRAAQGLPPKTRRRRRKILTTLKTPITPIFTANSVHEPVHEFGHLRGHCKYVASSSAVGVATSVCSLLVVP